jgi:transcriptional regulator with XRE-family HTH domain
MAVNLKQAIGVKVRAAREARALTQESLAEEVGRSVETISNIERAKVLPGIDVLHDISGVLGVPMAELVEITPAKKTMSRLRVEAQIQALVRQLPDDACDLVLEQIEAVHRRKPKR